MGAEQTFISEHGLWVLFALIFASGLGLPVPALPLLLAAGVLVGAGQLPLVGVVAGSLAAFVVADTIWYELGRWRGRSILALLCRISLEPDSCVRRTEELFDRRRTGVLLVSKFLPGLKTVSAPLAGMLEMPVGQFTLWNGAGSLLFVGALTTLGWLFSEQVERAGAPAARIGGWAVVALGFAFAGWLSWKYFARSRFLTGLRIARITPEELHSQLEAGGGIVVVDLRHPLPIGAEGAKVRGALQMTPAELESRHGEIPRDRDIVLYCDCPNEASAAQAALLLRQRGVTRVRPLLGGLAAWRARGYPIESIQGSSTSGQESRQALS